MFKRISFVVLLSMSTLSLSMADEMPPKSTSLKTDIAIKVISRTKLRQEARREALAYRFLDPGDEVIVVGESGEWLNVETKYKVSSGRIMVGYISKGSVQTTTASTASTSLSEIKNEKDTLILNQASEIERLMAELAKRDEEINRIRQEYKLKEMKLLRTVQDSITSLRDELEELKGKDKSRILALADVGETIFLDGAGEALMAVSGDRTILRFHQSNSDRANRYLGSVGEKHTSKEYIYYIAPTAALN